MSPAVSQTDRQIRIFISSTFRDMMRERDLLVKQVFPALRRICAKRFVTFTEVDLRWGVTEEQAAEGKVLPLCLAEIERSRPYFIGLLGERYGWIPDAIPAEVIEREPWLREHLYGRTSVTELEILHGVLNNPEMQRHAFFYFRDPAYAENPDIPDDERRELLEREIPAEIEKYGQEEASRRTQERKKKLTALKQRIRNSKLPLVETFANPEDLAGIIEKQFEDLINRLYPKLEIPDPLDRERMAHEAHARNKLFACIDRPSHLATLTVFADLPQQDGKGLVVTGESGCGKTALLAAWARDRPKSHSEEFIFQHYFGATPASSSPDGFLRRLLGELKSRYGITEEIPSLLDKLREALPIWLAQTVNRGRIILILDGLNQVQGGEPDRRLNFLPRYFPPNVVVLASALPGPALDALRERNWRKHELPLATREEVDAMVGEYFRMIGRLVDEKGVPLQTELRSQIVNAPGSKNPLFLRTVLEELRQFGSFEKLPDQVRHYLESNDPKELFLRVILRWQADFDNDINLVRRALTHLWAAREGLSESEWLELLGSNGNPLPRAHWTPLFLALEPHLSQRSGLFAFGHDFIRQSVAVEFLPTTDAQKDAHLELADYFETKELDDRKVEELPWQLLVTCEWQRLLQCVTNVPVFLLCIRASGSFREWYQYCSAIEKKYDLGKAFCKALRDYETSEPTAIDLADGLYFIGTFMAGAVSLEEAFPVLEQSLPRLEDVYGKDSSILAERLGSIGCTFLQHEMCFRSAEPFLRRALDLNIKKFGTDHPNTGLSQNNLAGFFTAIGDYDAATECLQRALTIAEVHRGRQHQDTATILNNLALIAFRTNRHKEAESLFREALQIREQCLQLPDPLIAASLENLGALLVEEGQIFEATSLLLQAEKAYRQVFGPHHTYFLRVKRRLEQIFHGKGLT